MVLIHDAGMHRVVPAQAADVAANGAAPTPGGALVQLDLSPDPAAKPPGKPSYVKATAQRFGVKNEPSGKAKAKALRRGSSLAELMQVAETRERISKKRVNFMFHPGSTFVTVWTMTSLIILLYIALMVPVSEICPWPADSLCAS
jgi:hypothetical protein